MVDDVISGSSTDPDPVPDPVIPGRDPVIPGRDPVIPGREFFWELPPTVGLLNR